MDKRRHHRREARVLENAAVFGSFDFVRPDAKPAPRKQQGALMVTLGSHPSLLAWIFSLPSRLL